MPDSAFALYLQAPEKVAQIADTAQTTKWGSLAKSISVSSPFAEEAGGNSEAQRRLNFFGGPLAVMRFTLGKLVDLSQVKGKVATIDRGLVYVLGGDVDRATGVTILIGLRRLSNG